MRYSLCIVTALFSLILTMWWTPASYSQTLSSQLPAPAPGSVALRAGVGTDPNLGLGLGIGGRYAWVSATGPSFEFGADFYYHGSSETKQRQAGGVTVDDKETTTLTVFGVRGNGLFNYSPDKGGVYFIAGFGFVVANVQWEENWTNPSGVNTYHDDLDVTSAGNIINFGIGMAWTSGVEARLETPMLYFYDSGGKAVSFAPTLTLSLLYRLQ